MFYVFEIVHNHITHLSTKGQHEIGKNHIGARLYRDLPKWKKKKDMHEALYWENLQ